MLFTNILVALTAAVVASAQDTSGVSPCILQCSTASAAQNNCSSIVDFQCVCSSAQFQADATNCMQQNCPDQVTAAVNIQLEQCGRISVSATGTTTAPNSLSITLPTSSPSTSASSTSSPAPTGAGNNGASSMSSSMAWSAVVAVGGAALGFAAL